MVLLCNSPIGILLSFPPLNAPMIRDIQGPQKTLGPMRKWKIGRQHLVAKKKKKGSKTITITVKKGAPNDPMPSIRCSQFLGSTNFLGKVYQLKEGTQTIKVDDFKFDSRYDLNRYNTFPGGPLYLINPYTKDQQSQNLTIYMHSSWALQHWKMQTTLFSTYFHIF